MTESYRKRIRIPGYDYRQSGEYFVTICTYDRKCTLCTITQDGAVQLSPQGEICKKWIEALSDQYEDVYVSPYCIMPNHIHLLLCVEHPVSRETSVYKPIYPKLGTYIAWLKYAITKEVRQNIGFADAAFFQRSYYEHIVRDRTDYLMIYDYILKNPLRWKEDVYRRDDAAFQEDAGITNREE